MIVLIFSERKINSKILLLIFLNMISILIEFKTYYVCMYVYVSVC